MVNGREYVQATADELVNAGWEAPEPFNIVDYTRETVAELFMLLMRASAQTVIGARTNRRLARKILHGIRNALRDVGADHAEISAAADTGPGPADEPDAELLGLVVMECAERRRAEMALGACRLPTATRGPKVVLALTRLVESLARAGVEPVGRAREGVAAGAPTPRRARVVRGESAEVAIEEEREGEDVEEERSGDAAGAVSPRTARPGRGGRGSARGREGVDGLIGGLPDDGWEP